MQIDPLADFFSGINPYSFAFDNPVLYSDPDGLAPMWWLKFRANVKQAVYNMTGRGNQHAVIHGRNRGRGVEVGARTSDRRMHKPTSSPSNNTLDPIDNEPSFDLTIRKPKIEFDIPNLQIPDWTPDANSDPDPNPVFRGETIPIGKKINYSERIQFDIKTDRFTNTDVVKAQLGDLVKLLMHNTGVSVYIAGNSFAPDGITGNGPDALNQPTSLNGTKTTLGTLMSARARAVYNFLVGQGVNPRQLIYGTGNVMSGKGGLSVSFEIRNK